LQQVFLKSSPPKTARGEDPLGNLRRQIRGVLLPKMISEGWPKVGTVVGSSGTIRALSRMLRKSMGRDKFDRKNLRRLISRMSSMTTTELLGIPGMEAKRVDMILAGAVLLEECLLATGAREIVPTDYSLRDGILEREIALHRKQSRGAAQFRLSDVEARARRLGANVAHLKQIESLAGTLFDSLRRLHRLDRRWKPYLLAAAVLHDVGEAISPIRHAQHSYYIVKNADFPSMEPWETEFIAQLCLHHKSGRLIKKNAVFAGEKEKKTALLKLLALLRVADALDRAHTSKVRIGKPRLARGKVLIRISGLPSSDLEILRVDQKKALFEELFRRKLVVESTR
ncbi:MAG: HD domain-containing protein, partial [Bdellovibrionota bacterium]